MEQYSYVFVVTGKLEAPSEEHARQQILMGLSLSGRLLQSKFDLALELKLPQPQPEVGPNGQQPRPIPTRREEH